MVKGAVDSEGLSNLTSDEKLVRMVSGIVKLWSAQWDKIAKAMVSKYG